MTSTPNQPKMVRWIVFAFIGIIFFLILSRTTFLTIDPGQAGVLFKRFGGGIEKDKIYEQGFHIVAPWNKMFVYDIRINERFEKMEVLSTPALRLPRTAASREPAARTRRPASGTSRVAGCSPSTADTRRRLSTPRSARTDGTC
jgi:hypothetical protein